MSPVSTKLAIRSSAMVAATMPTRPRRPLVTRDHDQNGAGVHLRTSRSADLGDTTRGRSEQLILHLHGLERRERSLGGDMVAFLHVYRLQKTGHRRPKLDPAGARS